jgi:hypothetical protein
VRGGDRDGRGHAAVPEPRSRADDAGADRADGDIGAERARGRERE